MGVIRTKNGVWKLDYRLPDGTGTEGRGTRIKKKTQIQNRRGAEAEWAKMKTELLENPSLARLQKGSFSELCSEYLAYSKTNKASWKADRSRLKNMLQFFGDNLPINKITSQLVERYKSQRLSLVKASTLNREISLMKHLMRKAVEWGYLSVNPTEGIKQLREENKMLRFISMNEWQRLHFVADDHLRLILELGFYTGMRRSEIRNLKWTHVDLSRRQLEIINSKSGKKRFVDIGEILFNTLQEVTENSVSEFVVTGRQGGQSKDWTGAFKKALKEAQIEDFRFHDLRHSFASHLVMGGTPLVTVSELLGHSNIQMTMRYSHLSPAHKRQAIGMLDKLVAKHSLTSQVINA